MSLSATANVDETGVSGAVTAAIAASSGGDHQQQPAEGHGGGDSSSSTVIGTTAASEDLTATSTSAIIGAAKQQLGQSAATGEAPRTRTARAATIRRRHKVKEFNDVISCYLCRGYLINATTVDYCVHSFCRSCIVRHLQENKHCPQCRPGSKQIGLSNLKPDERLKALVFKLVPGLYQREQQRQQFLTEGVQGKSGDEPDDGAAPCDAEEEYFSPVEPISLSLEYHPESLQGCCRQQIPPIRYLQCPAAVTVHHLKRFISSKFDIDPDNERVDIEIIYEDEVLPEDFSLMDVGYCYSWKRVAPMRFFYRILVHSLCNKLVQVPSDSVVTEGDTAIEAKRAKKSNEAGPAQKSVRFKELNEKQTKPVSGPVARDLPVEIIPEETNQTKYSIFKAKIAKTERGIDIKEESRNNNNIEAGIMPSKIATKVVDERSQVNGGKGPVKMTIIARKSNDIKVKHESSKNKIKSKMVPMIVPPVVEIPATTPLLSDFKSLRSNDVRYSDYSLGSSGVSVSSGGLSSSGKKCNSGKSKNISAAKELPQKAVSKCDIVVSIPQSHAHRSSNSSDDSFENLSLAQLKTANKKSSCTTPGVSPIASKENNEEESSSKLQRTQEKGKPDFPKPKIDLPSLKTKITVPKKSPEVIEIKKSPKSRKHSVEEQVNSPAINQVDLTTYAKNIGLKPIHPVVEEKDVKGSPNNSPSSASSSTSSPPSTCGSAFNFSQDVTSSSSHKKRKKAKHSKEPKEPGSKRRKLHAEIASQPAEESLKLKVKITANHKSHKAEKKLSSISSVEEVMQLPAINNPIVSAAPKTPTNETPVKSASTVRVAIEGSSSQNSIKPLPESKSPQENTKPTNRNKQGVNISNLNKALLEESSNINNLFKENSASKPAEQPVPITTPKQPVSPKSKATTSMGNKSITVTSVTIVTSAHTPSLSTVNQTQPKAIAPKIRTIQDSKIPISPPLPPSLFKTAPMTLQTISATSTKPSPSQVTPRHSAVNEMRQMPMNQLKRLTNVMGQKSQGNFVVPNPPKSLPSSPKLCPITSIASAANRQVAQLKRSVSLDSNPPILAKQQKLEHDRMIRKASYTPFIQPASTVMNITQAAGIKQQNNSLAVVTSALNIKPIEQQNFYTSTMGPSYTREVLTRKPMPILLPPSSISVTKMTDIIPSKLTHPNSAVTITPQQSQITTFPTPQQQKPALEIVRISSNIPPIDQQPITIINNNTVKPSPPKTTRPPPPPIPLVKIKRSVSQGNPVKPSITTVSAPVQQSPVLNNTKNIPAAKQATTTPAAASISATPPASSAKPNTTATLTSSEAKAGNGQLPMCDNIGALDLSGKSSRSPSQEKTSPGNSPPNTPTQTTTKDSSLANKQIAHNLEAALTKLKQQSSSPPQVSSSQTNSAQISTVSTTTSVESPKSPAPTTPTTPTTAAVPAFKTSKSPTQVTPKEPETSNGLQNLKMLSDSATNCEKIAIKNQRPIMPKLNEISKMRANPTVRQQNASVRNIPNPSALAFRSHQPIPMLASITKTTSPQKPTVSSVTKPPVATTTTLTSTSSNDQQKTQETTQVNASSQSNNVVTVVTTGEQPVSSATSASVTITTIATTDSSKLIGSKKSNLEQLAATLNLRALSAAADALKQSGTTGSTPTSAVTSGTTNCTPEVASKTVSSTSTSQATTSSAPSLATSSSESGTVTTSLPSNAAYSTVTISSTPASPAVSASSA